MASLKAVENAEKRLEALKEKAQKKAEKYGTPGENQKGKKDGK